MTDLSRRTAPGPALAQQETGAIFASVSSVDIEAVQISKSFGDNQIFSNLSFRLAQGETVALVGANGTGKSTLLRSLMGLIPINTGHVSLLNQKMQDLKGHELRKVRAQIGLVSQKHNLVPRVSVLSNVVHGLLGVAPSWRHWSHSLAPAKSRVMALQALSQVGLAHLATRRADRLSGGQSQRVAIARALVAKPKIIFADEPCASLDPAAGEDVMDLFFKLARNQGVTVVFTSHNIAHALRYGDRVLGLANGRLEIDATAASLKSKEIREIYA